MKNSKNNDFNKLFLGPFNEDESFDIDELESQLLNPIEDDDDEEYLKLNKLIDELERETEKIGYLSKSQADIHRAILEIKELVASTKELQNSIEKQHNEINDIVEKNSHINKETRTSISEMQYNVQKVKLELKDNSNAILQEVDKLKTYVNNSNEELKNSIQTNQITLWDKITKSSKWIIALFVITIIIAIIGLFI